MIAHSHGQPWNASEIAGSLGINYKTAQHYLDILTGSFMIRSLPTWTENLGKRVRRAPKICLRDSGLFHALQRVGSLSDLRAHPKLRASWEGLALASFVGREPSSGSPFVSWSESGYPLESVMLSSPMRETCWLGVRAA